MQLIVAELPCSGAGPAVELSVCVQITHAAERACQPTQLVFELLRLPSWQHVAEQAQCHAQTARRDAHLVHVFRARCLVTLRLPRYERIELLP
jgi:hypothetical protein